MQLTVILNVRHIAGPDHLDCSHVATWLQSQPGPVEGELMVCVNHADPINCDCPLAEWTGNTALYRVSVDEVFEPVAA